LLKKAYQSLLENGSDFVVANALSDLKLGYQATLIGKDNKKFAVKSKKSLFLTLDKILYKGSL